MNQLQLSSREQYELFVEQHPDIEIHAMNYHIASYLGITQQSQVVSGQKLKIKNMIKKLLLILAIVYGLFKEQKHR